MFIHPFPILLILFRVVGELETLPAYAGWDVGQTLDRLPVGLRANTQTEKQSHTYREFRVSSSLSWHVFELREKTGGSLCRHKENLQTLLKASRFERRAFWIFTEIYKFTASVFKASFFLEELKIKKRQVSVFSESMQTIKMWPFIRVFICVFFFF